MGTGRVSTIVASTPPSHQRCKVRQTPQTLTSILAMRLCRGMKSQDGTRSSENSSDISRTFFGIFLGLQRILRPFQGLLIFWVLQHFHASQKDPSKVMKRRRIWRRRKKFVIGQNGVKTFSENKCLLHVDISGDISWQPIVHVQYISIASTAW